MSKITPEIHSDTLVKTSDIPPRHPENISPEEIQKFRESFATYYLDPKTGGPTTDDWSVACDIADIESIKNQVNQEDPGFLTSLELAEKQRSN